MNYIEQVDPELAYRRGYVEGYIGAQNQILDRLKEWFDTAHYFVHPEDDKMIKECFNFLNEVTI